METIYADIAKRTGGNIYIGVVGPVRTGKSTLIKRIMEQLVIPNIDDPYRAARAKDELPQSGSGKTIMTSEPKFIPDEAVEISPDGTVNMRIRMIDSVGYMVAGASSAEEDGQERMVSTPWCNEPIPMTQAAELGTKKVMQDHCTIGLVVTTDGTITDIPRQDYIQAEDRAITDMFATGKPFLVIVNTLDPNGAAAQAVQERLRQKFHLEAVAADCQALDTQGIRHLLQEVLYAFPIHKLQVRLPRWLDTLPSGHPIKSALYDALIQRYGQIMALASAEPVLHTLRELEDILAVSVGPVDLSTGTVTCTLTFPEKLFYQILSDQTGMTVQNDADLMSLLTQLSQIKREYDKVADALTAVKATGYGVVLPGAGEMTLAKPEILHKNGAYGVKLKAGAPSIHMIRVDIDTEITPMVGNEQQSKDLIEYLTQEDPEQLWKSNIFGKSVYALVQEGLTGKLLRTPEEVRDKFRGTLSKIVNEGANGLICLIL